MSVTVEQLLKLPSLSRAKVVGGHNGLSKVVSSISVLESTDPGVLVDEVFPQGEFFGSEIVITGFLNSVDNVPLQLANIRRLAQGGEVGLILFYVGVYLPRIDPQLIALADELDFVLIAMPEGEATLRYGEVINDVMACIYRDRAQSSSIVLVAESEITGGAMHYAERVKKEFPQYDVRVSILGHVQRGGRPTAHDRILASRMGVAAIDALLEGQRNVMIGIQNNEVVYVPFTRAIKNDKPIDMNLVRVLRELSI